MATSTQEPEFHQAFLALTSSLEKSTIFDAFPEYRNALKVFAIPERVIQFRVTWEDDQHQVQVNQGFRVQFNSTLGPYKGGTRFHPSVNPSVLKFLALEQTLKNALTGINLGGAKGGSDFDPKGKSDHEIRRFCEAYMRELSRYIGADTDVPAGDVGVSQREVAWLFGAFRRQTGRWEGCITNKGAAFGGSLMKVESTGFGLVQFVQHMIRHATGGSEDLKGKKVAVSGAGNVARYAALKAIDLGAVVVSLSDSQGCVITKSAEGITKEDLALICALKQQRKQLSELLGPHLQRFTYISGQRPWQHVSGVDVALPCATQNELLVEDAEALIASGCRYVAEGSNMGCSQDAIKVFEAHRMDKAQQTVWFAPGKLANIGGSAVSGLEMAQNSQRETWPAAKVEAKLYEVIESCFKRAISAAEQYAETTDGSLPSLLVGGNIAGFLVIMSAMKAQGDWW